MTAFPDDGLLFDLPAPQAPSAPEPAVSEATVEAIAAGAVATVHVDSPLPHLDRPFDYVIPVKWREVVAVGSRVRVRFAGQLVSAVVTEVGSGSGYGRSLLPVTHSSDIPNVTEQGIALARAVARRYAGATWDVLRLMVPPRVASVEKRNWRESPTREGSYSDALALARTPVPVRPGERVVWQALPESTHRSAIPAATVVSTALHAIRDGGSAIVVVPDARAVAAVLEECARLGLRRWAARSGGDVAVLDHDDGPAQRFGSYLAAMHGHARLVVGTRPTALQPVPDLRLIALWDEANGVYEDPHAPYPHARAVAALRATEGAALLCGGYALSAESAALVAQGWARLEAPSTDATRSAVPAVDIVNAARRDEEGGAGWHWMPGSVWRRTREALGRGPVGIVVPRAGYVKAVACGTCDAWAVCRECESLLEVPAFGTDPVCQEAAHRQPDWHCPECHGAVLKHVRQGADRIGEQLARMLGDVPLTVSSASAGIVGDGEVTGGAVLATPGALPAVPGGYAHLVIVDAGVAASIGLGGELNALRWWLGAAALVRSRTDGGMVSVVGTLPPVVERALAAWSPAAAALAEYEERAQLGLPPHRRHLTVLGPPSLVNQALASARVADSGMWSGDVTSVIPIDGGRSVLVPRQRAIAVVDALKDAQREASRAGQELRLRVDGPLALPR
ncbi:hypothetical protein [Demequina sp.]|uniref:primosomal protein N' family DNA-binding protein n=1 Tax=Demequina sp. TaxID=2050685 RepID=UPI003A866747